MMYIHTPRFQAVLKIAFGKLVCGPNQKVSRRAIEEEIGENGACLNCSSKTVERFLRNNLGDEMLVFQTQEFWSDSYNYLGEENEATLSPDDCSRLWNHLQNKGLIKPVIREIVLEGRSLHNLRHTANVISAFYKINDKELQEYMRIGGTGNFFCYKRSFIDSNYIIKSKITIDQRNQEYLYITEKQTWNQGGIVVEEESTGMGFIKSNRAWIMLKKKDDNEPRVICLSRKQTGKISRGQRPQEELLRMFGHIMESNTNRNDSFHSFYIAISSVRNERALCGPSYDEEKQVGAFRADTDMNNQFNDTGLYVDSIVYKYIEYGIISSS